MAKTGILGMKQKYYVVVAISVLLLGLSLSISFINYYNALKSSKEQLIHHSLPLSLDNIYTVIQKNLIEPYLVSSMMANDTFVQDWLMQNNPDEHKIAQYLGAIKNKYNMDNAFLVSEYTKNYYAQSGFIEKIDSNNTHNQWYFEFKQSSNTHEINLDSNSNLSNQLMMFINYKIFNSSYQLLGITGIVLKISYIDEMLQRFRVNYNFLVTFFNKEGRVILAERGLTSAKNIDEIPYYGSHKEEILSKETRLFEYEKDGYTYILTSKYIPELNLYLTVDVKLDTFTKDVRQSFIINFLVSLLITFLVAFTVYRLIRNHNAKLEFLAQNDTLTHLPNRRHFEEFLGKKIDRFKAKGDVFYLLFFDIDDFKSINDTKGHFVGDMVLKEVASIAMQFLQKDEMLARWGGEEFVMTYMPKIESNLFDEIEQLRKRIATDDTLAKYAGRFVTASIGVSGIRFDDTLGSLIVRADVAMYRSKQHGKNRVTLD